MRATLRGRRQRVPASPVARALPAVASVRSRARSCACGGTCPRCDGTLQRKVEFGQPTDRYEQEAEAVGDRAMRMPAPPGQRMVEPITPLVQRRARQISPGPDVPSVVHDVVASRGEPLERGARAFFEARFNRDFSNVRVHGDPVAGESARAIDARAYTLGHHLVFGAGEYAPGTEQGKRLLAHELTHVVQQDAAGEPGAHAPAPVLQRSEGKGKRGGSAGGGKTVIIYAGGFDQYGGDAIEAERLHRNRFWMPGTKDFAATASETGMTGYPATKAAEFFGPLRTVDGPIGRIVFIGHGSGNFLALSGNLGGWDERLGAAELNTWAATVDQEIKPKLTSTATIDLFSCDSARDGVFASLLAAAFGICVRGYNDGVKWCITFEYNDADPSSSKITSRGRWVGPGVSADEHDCDAPEWNRGVGSAVPPEQVCPGSTPSP